MGFLHPLYLLAALAAVIPLIIHLLHRRRVRIEVFPSLEFLRRMMRRKSRRFHLKQILLLIARMLLLLFIALALARPTITGGRVVKGHLPTTAVIILDDSYSMQRRSGDGRLFDLARAKVLDLLGYFDRSDEVHLFAGSTPSRDLGNLGGDPARLHDRISEVECSNLVTDIEGPFRQALSLLGESQNPNKEIYIVSDMQNVGWDWKEDVGDGEGSGIKVMVVDLGEEDPNACVRSLGFRIPSGSDDLELDATFERFNSEGEQGRVAEVFMTGVLLDRAVFSPGEFTRETETFHIPAFDGLLWGEVAIAEDKLELDDRRYFALPSRRRVVGIVGDSYYIRTALSPEGGGSFEPVEIEEGSINPEALARVDILVVTNVARFTPLEIGAITDYLAGGGSMLVFLGNRVDTGAYNRNLLPRLGKLSIEGVSDGGQSGFYTIERFDRSHAIFAKFRPEESPFSDAKFYHLMKVNPGEGRTVATFSDGSPAIIEATDRVMVFASAADIEWNDLVFTSQFLPILHETLLYLSSETRLSQSYDLGQEIVIRVSGAESEVMLDGPTGVVRHFPEALGQTRRYRIDSPEMPGIYFVKTERETLSVFAVNVQTSESDLTKVRSDQVRSKLRHFEVKTVTAVDDIGESVALLRRGRDLARTFLWAALILVVFETLLASNISLGFRGTEDEDTLTDS